MITGRKYVFEVLKRDQVRLTKEYSRIVTAKGVSPYQDECSEAMAVIHERVKSIQEVIEILEVI